MRIPCLAALTLGFLANPAFLWAQPSFGGGGFSKGGGFSDPTAMFQKLAGDRTYFLLSDTRMLREPLQEWMKKNGITDDKVTKATFDKAWPSVSESMKTRFSGFGGFGGGKPGGPPSFGGPSSSGGMKTPTPMSTTATTAGASTPAATTASNSPTDPKAWAEADFKRRDENSDGKLNSDEMSSSLRGDLGKWDTNKDSLIDLSEFLPYFQARMEREQGGESKQATALTIIIEEDIESRPVVYRAGKLPKELPAWFKELDIDTDGQVSLYEWRKPKKEVEEFKQYDRNDDGFLIAEEVLRQQTMTQNGTAPKTANATPTTSSGRPSFGGFGGGGFGGFGGPSGGPGGGAGRFGPGGGSGFGPPGGFGRRGGN